MCWFQIRKFLLTTLFLISTTQSNGQISDEFSTGSFSLPDDKNPIVFVPGIFGSRLIVDGEQIWGGIGYAAQKMLFDSEQNVETEVLTAVSGFGRKFGTIAYGSYFVEQASDPDAGTYFHPFSYDWRASNEKSAQLLGGFLCDVPSSKTSPIILIAHSMGGLVVKHWLMDAYEKKCSNGNRVEIGSIVFIATPHTGSPKAFLTLVDKADLVGIKPIDAYLLKSINEYGYSFDSIYELLPFGTASDDDGDCYSQEYKKEGPAKVRLFYKKSDARRPVAIDPYSTPIWESLGLLHNIADLSDRFPETVSNPREYLNKKLTSAERIACKLSRFEMPTELSGRVIYIAGRITTGRSIAARSTVSEVWVTNYKSTDLRAIRTLRDSSSGRSYYIYTKLRDGDKTVPFAIAANTPVDATYERAITQTRQANEDHLGIMTSPLIREISDSLGYFRLNRKTEFLPMYSPGDPINELAALETLAKRMGTWQSTASFKDAVSADGLINVSALALAGKSTFDQNLLFRSALGTVVNSSAFAKTLDGSFQSAEDLETFVVENPSAGNWRYLGSVEGLSPESRTSAKMKAADLFFFEGKVDEAAATYHEVANDEKTGSLTVNGRLLRKLAEIGFQMSTIYAGPEAIFNANRTAVYDLSDAQNWEKLDIDALEKILNPAVELDSEAWEDEVWGSFYQ